MRYEGEWNQGRRHGKGILTFANGDCYDGEWENDRVCLRVRERERERE
jgi:hypothetical protein